MTNSTISPTTPAPTYQVLAWGASAHGNRVAIAASIEEVLEIARSLDTVGQTAQIFNLSWGHGYVVTWGKETGGGASAKCFGDELPEDANYLLNTLNR